jgi:hypothetical protein
MPYQRNKKKNETEEEIKPLNLKGIEEKETNKELSVGNDAQQKKEADARNMAAYGTTNPSQSQILQRLYGLQKGDKESILASKEINPLTEAQAQTPSTMNEQQFAKQQQQQQLLLQKAQEVGQVNNTPIEQNPIDVQQALGAGVTGAGIGAAGAGSLGALATAATGGAALPVALAVTGVAAISGFVTGVVSNLKQQRAGDITAEVSNIKTGSTALRAIIQDTNSGGNTAENIDLFNYQLARIDEAYSKLHLETQSSLNKFLGKDGTPELEKFESFYSAGGMKDYLVNEMQQAILNPNPNKQLITISDVGETE